MKKIVSIFFALAIISCGETEQEEKQAIEAYEPTKKEQKEQEERMDDKTSGRVKPVEKKGF